MNTLQIPGAEFHQQLTSTTKDIISAIDALQPAAKQQKAEKLNELLPSLKNARERKVSKKAILAVLKDKKLSISPVLLNELLGEVPSKSDVVIKQPPSAPLTGPANF